MKPSEYLLSRGYCLASNIIGNDMNNLFISKEQYEKNLKSKIRSIKINHNIIDSLRKQLKDVEKEIRRLKRYIDETLYVSKENQKLKKELKNYKKKVMKNVQEWCDKHYQTNEVLNFVMIRELKKELRILRIRYDDYVCNAVKEFKKLKEKSK